jgi:hypothetical protein
MRRYVFAAHEFDERARRRWCVSLTPPDERDRVDDAYPHLSPLLATPCDLQVYEKPLGDQ